MTEFSSMDPIPVPDRMKELYPEFEVATIGPPSGMSDQEVGSPECLVGYTDFDLGRRLPTFSDFWRPTAEQLELLNAGGVLELRLYVPQLVMHSLSVHALPAEPDQ